VYTRLADHARHDGDGEQPLRQKGVLWDTYRKHFGPNGSASVLVAHGTSRQFNPTIPEAEIARLLEKDPIKNRAEYLAEFRSDLQSFVSSEIVEACIAHGVHERAPHAASATTASLILAAGVLTHSPCASATCLTGRKPS